MVFSSPMKEVVKKSLHIQKEGINILRNLEERTVCQI
jgi:hypothetical protein